MTTSDLTQVVSYYAWETFAYFRDGTRCKSRGLLNICSFSEHVLHYSHFLKIDMESIWNIFVRSC